MLETEILKTSIKNPSELGVVAKQIRATTIDSIYRVGSGHSGPSLSMVEIVTTLLFEEMDWREHLGKVKDKGDEEQWRVWQQQISRDRFILSKGHAVPSWYAALAVGGYIAEEELKSLRSINSRLQGHPVRARFPFIDATTGSLGQGPSEAVGMALAMQRRRFPHRVYCIIGDGECDEGQIWEAALAAPKFKLDKLILIIDANKKQGEGLNSEIMPIEPLEEKWKSFNWHVQRLDGHSILALQESFKVVRETLGKPHVIIADTFKGYLGNGQLFINGAHNPTIDEENYTKAMKFLGMDNK